LPKRSFTIDTGTESVPVEGYEHQKVAIRYLMKRRRSLLSTKDKSRVESMFTELPSKITVIGKQLTRSYFVKWERVSTGDFAGARFTFSLEEDVRPSSKASVTPRTEAKEPTKGKPGRRNPPSD
jgi:hypothetical protein